MELEICSELMVPSMLRITGRYFSLMQYHQDIGIHIFIYTHTDFIQY